MQNQFEFDSERQKIGSIDLRSEANAKAFLNGLQRARKKLIMAGWTTYNCDKLIKMAKERMVR